MQQHLHALQQGNTVMTQVCGHKPVLSCARAWRRANPVSELQVFALGFVSVFDQVLDGIPVNMADAKNKVCGRWQLPRAPLSLQRGCSPRCLRRCLSHTCRAWDEEPAQYRQDTEKMEAWAKELSSPSDLTPSSDGTELQKCLAGIAQHAKDGTLASAPSRSHLLSYFSRPQMAKPDISIWASQLGHQRSQQVQSHQQQWLGALLTAMQAAGQMQLRQPACVHTGQHSTAERKPTIAHSSRPWAKIPCSRRRRSCKQRAGQRASQAGQPTAVHLTVVSSSTTRQPACCCVLLRAAL